MGSRLLARAFIPRLVQMDFWVVAQLVEHLAVNQKVAGSRPASPTNEREKMNLIKCDGCEKISPDKDGIHIANHWVMIRFSHKHEDSGSGRVPRRWHEKEFCLDCWDRIQTSFEAKVNEK